MNKENALINEAVGAMLKAAMDKYPRTQLEIASKLNISTKQLQNYGKGIFPKYKGDNIKALDELLKTNAYDKLYKSEPDLELSVLQEPSREDLGPSYLRQRWMDKLASDEYFVPFIPFKARAGYSRNYENADFLKDEFDMYQLPPGINPRGADWRWFEVGGDSMSPLLEENDVLLCSLVPVADWLEIEDFKIYVVVWKNHVSVKRLAVDKGDFVLISENEADHPQRRVPLSDIKEVWKLRRQLNARFPPTKRFKIIV